MDLDREGEWARHLIRTNELRSPHHLLAEVTSALRRAELSGVMPSDSAALAHENLLGLTMVLYPYEPLAARVWELRQNVTPYDAWYVALAEAFKVSLATLDRRLATAVGPRCSFVLPPA